MSDVVDLHDYRTTHGRQLSSGTVDAHPPQAVIERDFAIAQRESEVRREVKAREAGPVVRALLLFGAGMVVLWGLALAVLFVMALLGG